MGRYVYIYIILECSSTSCSKDFMRILIKDHYRVTKGLIMFPLKNFKKIYLKTTIL